MRFRFAALTVIVLATWGRPVAGQTQSTPNKSTPGWVFTPAMGVGGVWENNVFILLEDDNPPSDYASPLNPSLSLDFTGRNTKFSAGYNGSFTLYRTLEELNNYQQSLRGQFERRLTRRVRLVIDEDFEAAPTTDALERGDVPFHRVGSKSNMLSASLESALGAQTSLNGGYVFRVVEFDAGPLRSTELKGGHSHELELALVHGLSRRLSLTLDYEFVRAIVSGSTLFPELEDRFNIQAGSGTLQYAVMEDFNIFGGIGLAHLGAGLTHEARTGPTWRAGLSRKIDRTTLSAMYRRSYTPSFGFGGTSQNEELTGNVHVAFARNRAYVSGSTTWSENDALDARQRSLRSLWLTGRVGYAVARWMTVEGYYGRAQQDSQVAGGKRHRHMVGFQVITSKPVKLLW